MTPNQYYVSLDGAVWKVTHCDRVLTKQSTRELASSAARAVALRNQPSQVLVQKRDGTFRAEWTYEDYPYRSTG